MLRKILFISLSALIISCGVKNRKEAQILISEFVQTNKIDKRETVFDIEATFLKGKLVLKGETDNPALKSKLLKSLSQYKYTDQISVLPDSTVGKNSYGLINLSVANLRSKPHHSAELATQAFMGTPVKILKKSKGWYLIQTPDKYISWVDNAGIHPISEDTLESWRITKRILCTDENGTIYKESTLKTPVSDVTLGCILKETERTWSAIKVQLPDGRTGFTKPTGWLDSEQFKSETKIDTTYLKELGKNYTGRPYLWGGTSARAMDCSGFVKTLYFMNGIILARDASLQTHHGELVDTNNNFDQLQTGDLLFFGRKADSEQNESITHVALSLGKTEYIHAAGRIQFNSFDPQSDIYSDYRKESFIRARRIVGSEDLEGIQTIKNHPWY